MSRLFWFTLLGSFSGLAFILGLISYCLRQNLGRILAPVWQGKKFREGFNLSQKLTWQDFFESNLRAATGKELTRPFGTARHYFDWEQIQFKPVYLSRQPQSPAMDIDTSIVLGPQAKKPLVLKIPILIGAMSYGNALSLEAKVSLAKASTLAGTATCSGNGPFLPEERQAADHYIFQYSRGFWSKTETIFRQADLIEIGLGHGAWVSAPVRIQGQKIDAKFGKRVPTIPGLDILIEASLPEIDGVKGLKNLIANLKEVSGGVPIGVKFGLTHYVEEELKIMVEAGVDVVVLDGLEGGTHGGPPFLLDDIGLPGFPGICRAVRYLEKQKLRGRLSLVVGGGLTTPGDFAKSLALGADAVMIGTIAALTLSHTQVVKSIPWEPPTGLVYYDCREQQKFDPELGSQNLSYFLESSIREMKSLARTLGKTGLQGLDKDDLVAMNPLYAQIAGIQSSRDFEYPDTFHSNK